MTRRRRSRRASCAICPFTPAALSGLVALLSASGPKHAELARGLRPSSPQTSAGRLAAWRAYMLIAAGKVKALSSLAPKSAFREWPELEGLLDGERARMEAFCDTLAAARTLDATAALLTLGAAVLRSYDEGKRLRGALDFQDLIVRTAALLTRSGASNWVHYKLDRGLDHILVDEAQDTSPLQWEVITRLAEEFFAGRGSRDGVRTFFAVGDEKQSIYSFQGAVPAWFARQRQRFGSAAADARAPLPRARPASPVPLDRRRARRRRRRLRRAGGASRA